MSASASGGVMSLTLTSHASSSISPPASVTSSLNDIVSSGEPSSGADAVIDSVVMSGGSSATGPPSVWLHEYDAMPSSGSLEAVPSSVNSPPSSTDAGHDTRASGAAFCHSTLTICSVEACSVPSETVSLNLSDYAIRERSKWRRERRHRGVGIAQYDGSTFYLRPGVRQRGAVRIARTAAVQRDRIPRVDGRGRYCRRGHGRPVGIRDVEDGYRGFHGGRSNCWAATGDAQRELQGCAQGADGRSGEHRSSLPCYCSASRWDPRSGARNRTSRLSTVSHSAVTRSFSFTILVGRGDLAPRVRKAGRPPLRWYSPKRRAWRPGEEPGDGAGVSAFRQVAGFASWIPPYLWGNYGPHDRCSERIRSYCDECFVSTTH